MHLNQCHRRNTLHTLCTPLFLKSSTPPTRCQTSFTSSGGRAFFRALWVPCDYIFISKRKIYELKWLPSQNGGFRVYLQVHKLLRPSFSTVNSNGIKPVSFLACDPSHQGCNDTSIIVSCVKKADTFLIPDSQSVHRCTSGKFSLPQDPVLRERTMLS